MGNSWFRFKQFTVQQGVSAMKVTTDACLFGAWCADQWQTNRQVSILDIGTGTGLLSLMLAQKMPNACITALEIDKNTAAEAALNGRESPFGSRIRVVEGDILQFQPTAPFDFIICNPPFHQNQLSSPLRGKRMAHHAESLTLADLMPKIPSLMGAYGRVAFLLPCYREEEITALAAQQNLYPQALLRARQTEGHPHFRTMLLLGLAKTDISPTSITIMDDFQKYTPAFSTLLAPFYLKL